MAKSIVEFEFIYHRPKYFPPGSLKHYRGGVTFKKGDIVKADEKEVNYFTNKVIGKNHLFEKKRGRVKEMIDEVIE